MSSFGSTVVFGNHKFFPGVGLRGNHRLFGNHRLDDGEEDSLLVAMALGTASGGAPADRGVAPPPPAVPADPALRLARLASDTATALCASSFAGLLWLDLSSAAPRLGLGEEAILTLVPPGIEDLAGAVERVRAMAVERQERIYEIVAQTQGTLAFLTAPLDLGPARGGWTRLLLAAAHQAVVGIEVRLKFHASLPRPVEFAPDLYPLLPSPGHPTWPAGHATESFAAAALIAALRLAGMGDPDPVATILAGLAAPERRGALEAQVFAAAARIAENRTVAGLHFPVDNGHGAVLGLSIGLAYAAVLSRRTDPLPAWTAEAAPWAEGFSLERVAAALGQATGSAPVPVLSAGSPLHALWAAAAAEWGPAPDR